MGLKKFVEATEIADLIEEQYYMLSRFETDTDSKCVEVIKNNIDYLEQKLINNPDGYFSDIEGDKNYKAFCEKARRQMKFNPDATFEVVEGKAKSPDTWLGYERVKINAGVLRYLQATK